MNEMQTMENMEKKGFLGLRLEEDSLKFIKEEAKKSNETMSNWIRNQIIIKKERKTNEH